LFKALIQIEANTQFLLPDLWCECCRLSPHAQITFVDDEGEKQIQWLNRMSQ